MKNLFLILLIIGIVFVNGCDQKNNKPDIIKNKIPEPKICQDDECCSSELGRDAIYNPQINKCELVEVKEIARDKYCDFNEDCKLIIFEGECTSCEPSGIFNLENEFVITVNNLWDNNCPDYNYPNCPYTTKILNFEPSDVLCKNNVCTKTVISSKKEIMETTTTGNTVWVKTYALPFPPPLVERAKDSKGFSVVYSGASDYSETIMDYYSSVDIDVKNVKEVFDGGYLKQCRDCLVLNKKTHLNYNELIFIEIDAGGLEVAKHLGLEKVQKGTCEYNKEYSSNSECICDGDGTLNIDGIWTIYEGDMSRCTPNEEPIYICRKLDYSREPTPVMHGVVSVIFSKETTYDDAKDLVRDAGGIIRRYDCEWDRKYQDRQMVVDVNFGEEDGFIERVMKDGPNKPLIATNLFLI